MNSHPVLIYLFSIYSIYYLFQLKSRNEFLIISTLFLFLLQFGSFPNRIDAIITAPINLRPMDVALMVLVVVVFHQKFSRRKFSPVAFRDPLVSFFLVLAILYTAAGIVRFGYPAIAEFRSVLFFIVILVYVSVSIRMEEIVSLIRSISTYLMPLILLVPLNLILINNFSISMANRQFNAFIYETVTVGFLSGYLYYQYIDRKYKLPVRLLPVFLAMIPYCSHRTVWGIIFVTLPIILYWTRQNKYLIYATVLGVFITMYFQIDPTFLENRLTAFTNIDIDPTGRWRIYIWQAVISQATFWGKGLGARWHVVADVIGEQAKYGAHNGYVQTLYYLGYLGAIAIIVMITYFLVHFYARINLKNAQEKIIYRLSFLSSIALVLYMFGYGPDLLSWFFIGFGLKLNYYKKNNGFSVETRLSKNFHRYPIVQ